MTLAGPMEPTGRELADALPVNARRMFENIALSKARIKNLQRDEEDLSTDQKVQLLEELFQRRPAIFLERFHPYLCEDDMECFEHVSQVYEVDFYLKEARRRLDAGKASVLVKNRRYEALKRLENEGSYFSDDEMRSRDPHLYEQLVGQYMTDEELTETRKKIDPSDLRFSTILMTFIDEQETKMLLKMQQDLEDGAQEEEEEEEEDDDDIEDEDQRHKPSGLHASHDEDEEEELMDADGASAQSPRRPTPADEEEKLRLREEFVRHMRERFLSGGDRDFDYRAVDSNVEFDSLIIRGWDEEERYFDDEDPHNIDAGDGREYGGPLMTKTDNSGDDLDDYEKWTPESNSME